MARAAAALLLVVALAGCGSTAARPGRPSPAPSAGTATPVPLAVWQAKGATEPPPPSLGRVSLGSVQVVNQTAGAVSDADARRWALDYLRANGYELWAWNHLQDGFLLRSGLSRSPIKVFAYDLDTIQRARSAGATLRVVRLQLRRLVLRPVPPTLRQPFADHLFVWTPYAFYLDQIGPAQVVQVDGQGHETVLASLPQGVGSPELVGGEPADDPPLGQIWVADSDWDCTAPGTRQLLGTLCNA